MIKLELSIDDCNMILRVLGKHPFEEVVAVINKIKAARRATSASHGSRSCKKCTS
jgi:hypothetical protein